MQLHGSLHSLLQSPILLSLALSPSFTSLSRAQVLPTASDFYVRSLPGAPDGPLLRMHAGHIEVNESTHGSLFFWHYQNRHIESRPRTVIWLNGGPGCSSMDGNLMEVGPYRVGEGGKLRYNNGSWDEFANLLFVDNPVGTGFSFVDSDSYIHELQEMADNFVAFLESFYLIFPEYATDDIYIAGESYAGQHIPYIAKTILERNKKNYAVKWNLAGLLIGNGWISDQYQSPVNLQFAYENGMIKKGSRGAKTIEDQQKRCQDKLKETDGEDVDTGECEGILQAILRETRDLSGPAEQACVNMYDIKLRDSYPSCGMNWPPDLTQVTPYLRDPAVLRALHIDTSKKAAGWTECNGQVSGAFTTRNSKPSFDLLPSLLEHVPIVLFSGADDLICNHVGTENLIAHLNWNGATGFPESAATKNWTFDGANAGTYRADRNLSYVLFKDSSHMVPFDYPKRARDMLDRFMGIAPSLRYPGSKLDGEATATTPSPPLHKSPDIAKPAITALPDAEDMTDEETAIAEQARWDAYYRSGEVALVLVIIMAGAFGWWVWRDRRRRAGYTGLEGGNLTQPIIDGVKDVGSGAVRLESFRHKPSRDENGVYADDGGEEGRRASRGPYANGGTHHANGGVRAEQAGRYSLGSDEESEEDRPTGQRNGGR